MDILKLGSRECKYLSVPSNCQPCISWCYLFTYCVHCLILKSMFCTEGLILSEVFKKSLSFITFGIRVCELVNRCSLPRPNVNVKVFIFVSRPCPIIKQYTSPYIQSISSLMLPLFCFVSGIIHMLFQQDSADFRRPTLHHSDNLL